MNLIMYAYVLDPEIDSLDVATIEVAPELISLIDRYQKTVWLLQKKEPLFHRLGIYNEWPEFYENYGWLVEEELVDEEEGFPIDEDIDFLFTDKLPECLEEEGLYEPQYLEIVFHPDRFYWEGYLGESETRIRTAQITYEKFFEAMKKIGA